MSIHSLMQLPDRELLNEAIARSLLAAPILISGFDPTEMALAVYAASEIGLGAVCDPPRSCPLDHTGRHQTEAMTPVMVASYVGDEAEMPVVDGLAPATIRHMKAHTAHREGLSNWDCHALVRTQWGDVASYGAVYTRVQLKNGRELRFIVAASGTDPYKDELWSYIVARTIVMLLIKEGYIETVAPESTTFVTGADTTKVEAFAASVR